MREQVEKTVEVIRPALRADGGDIILHDVDEDTGVITVELIGACVGCPASTQTLKAGIERIMRDRIDGVTEVVNVGDDAAATTIRPAELFDAARDGDRTAARPAAVADRARRRRRPGDRPPRRPAAGEAYTVGITGAPGSGKSTLTSALVGHVRSTGDDVAVLAIDPSSPFTGGAILGDRVRMQDHATDPGVFIRSMATRGHLGGLALATPEAVRLLDALGRRLILIETVGVGQVEVEVAGKADTTIVVVNPGWGDSVQANKAGLMEVADVFVINKADRAGADETRRDLEQMLDLSASTEWRPPIVPTVATTGAGRRRAVGRRRRPPAARGRSRDCSNGAATARMHEELGEIVTRRLREQRRGAVRRGPLARAHRGGARTSPRSVGRGRGDDRPGARHSLTSAIPRSGRPNGRNPDLEPPGSRFGPLAAQFGSAW